MQKTRMIIFKIIYLAIVVSSIAFFILYSDILSLLFLFIVLAIPVILFITAASPNETSRASVWSNVLHVYRSNGFTHGFQEAISSNSSISLRDLYYHLARSTSGSHVKVYNTACYGSVYDNTMAEFLNCD